ncbi:hypothetical protein CNY89_16155 [Amaricoccus sp. HAR-UPW-R2A-40]|nr:hypothetical protein CNY89_16155 [Amaricoccus sp. HAR-UPW-R2A-40]
MLQHIHRIVPFHWAITSFYVLVLLAAPLQVYSSTMLLEFLFGMGVAVLAARRRQPRRWPASRSVRCPGSGAGRSF